MERNVYHLPGWKMFPCFTNRGVDKKLIDLRLTSLVTEIDVHIVKDIILRIKSDGSHQMNTRMLAGYDVKTLYQTMISIGGSAEGLTKDGLIYGILKKSILTAIGAK